MYEKFRTTGFNILPDIKRFHGTFQTSTRDDVMRAFGRNRSA